MTAAAEAAAGTDPGHLPLAPGASTRDSSAMTVLVVVAVFSAILALAMAADRSRSRRNSWSGGSHRRGHAPEYLAGGAVIGGDAGGGGFDGGGGGGGGDGGGGGC